MKGLAINRDTIAADQLSGVSEVIWQRLLDTENTASIPEADVFLADDILGSSSHRALAAAEKWLTQDRPTTSAQDEPNQTADEPG